MFMACEWLKFAYRSYSTRCTVLVGDGELRKRTCIHASW